jgi:hypothetical protein
VKIFRVGPLFLKVILEDFYLLKKLSIGFQPAILKFRATTLPEVNAH